MVPLQGIRLLYRDRWVPVTTAWRVLRLRMEERPAVWRVAANILINSRGEPTRGGPSACDLGGVLTTAHCKKVFCCEMFRKLRTWTILWYDLSNEKGT